MGSLRGRIYGGILGFGTQGHLGVVAADVAYYAECRPDNGEGAKNKGSIQINHFGSKTAACFI
jgi:hypothetical protein